MLTNEQYWDSLYAAGKLYSIVKDGEPTGFFQQLLGHTYVITLVVLIIFFIFLVMKLSPAERKWKSFFLSVGPLALVGIISECWLLHVDPHFPEFVFPPWSTLGITFIIPLEDYFFYPLTTGIFYILYRKLIARFPLSEKNTPPSSLQHYLIIGIFSGFALFSIFCMNLAGKAAGYMFFIPGILAYIYAKDTIRAKPFIIFTIVLILANTLWDWIAVSWIHHIPGLSWAVQWFYIAWDQAGNYSQSKVLLDYKTHPWAWIFENPVEITPWFGICGGILDYSFFAAADKILRKYYN